MIEAVEWSETRATGGDRELFFVSAERRAHGWEFLERSTWEVRWFALAPTPERVTRAEELLREAASTPR